jgi:hypothetical protein
MRFIDSMPRKRPAGGRHAKNQSTTALLRGCAHIEKHSSATCGFAAALVVCPATNAYVWCVTPCR